MHVGPGRPRSPSVLGPATGLLGVVGLGKLGGVLVRCLEKAGHRVVAYDLRQTEFTILPAAQDVIDASSVIFLALPDDSIEPFVAGHRFENRTVVHVSGSLDLSVLEAARSCGARVGSFHPIQTFTGVETSLAGVTVGIEADEPLRSTLMELARSLGAVGRVLRPGHRAAYHLAPVLVSNFTVVLFDWALELLERGGLARLEARQALVGVLTRTAENLDRAEPREVLTGPVARGDVGTVAHHLRYLALHVPGLLSAYRSLTAHAVKLTGERHDGLTIERFETLLSTEEVCPCD